jgi:hypothetical protein
MKRRIVLVLTLVFGLAPIFAQTAPPAPPKSATAPSKDELKTEEKLIEQDIQSMSATAQQLQSQAQLLSFLVTQKQQRRAQIEAILNPPAPKTAEPAAKK